MEQLADRSVDLTDSQFGLSEEDLAELRKFKGTTTILLNPGWQITKVVFLAASPFYATLDVSFRVPNPDFEEGDPEENRYVPDTKTLILRRPAPAVIALRDGDDGEEILLTWQERHGSGLGGYELPGGMGKSGEDKAVTAARELESEAGLRVDPTDLDYLATVHRDVARSVGLEAPLFTVKVPPGTSTMAPKAELGEHIHGAQWVPLNRLIKEQADGGIHEAVLAAAIGIFMARRMLEQ